MDDAKNYFFLATELIVDTPMAKVNFLRYEKMTSLISLISIIFFIITTFVYLGLFIYTGSEKPNGWLTWSGPSIYDPSYDVFTTSLNVITNIPYRLAWLIFAYPILLILFQCVPIYSGWKTLTQKVLCSTECGDSSLTIQEIEEEPMEEDQDIIFYYYELLLLGTDKVICVQDCFAKSLEIWIIGSICGISDIFQLCTLIVLNIAFYVLAFLQQWTNTGYTEFLRFDRDNVEKSRAQSTFNGKNNTIDIVTSRKTDPETFIFIKKADRLIWAPFALQLAVFVYMWIIIFFNFTEAYLNNDTLQWYRWAAVFIFLAIHLFCLLFIMIKYKRFEMLGNKYINIYQDLKDKPQEKKILNQEYRLKAIKLNGDYKIVNLLTTNILEYALLIVFLIALYV